MIDRSALLGTSRCNIDARTVAHIATHKTRIITHTHTHTHTHTIRTQHAEAQQVIYSDTDTDKDTDTEREVYGIDKETKQVQVHDSTMHRETVLAVHYLVHACNLMHPCLHTLYDPSLNHARAHGHTHTHHARAHLIGKRKPGGRGTRAFGRKPL